MGGEKGAKDWKLWLIKRGILGVMSPNTEGSTKEARRKTGKETEKLHGSDNNALIRTSTHISNGPMAGWKKVTMGRKFLQPAEGPWVRQIGVK